MSKKQLKKVSKANKSKKDILSDIQLNQHANMMRDKIKNTVYPYLVGTKETISYHKLFLQSLSGLINGIYDEKTKVVTVGSLMPELNVKLNSILNAKDPAQKIELDRYLGFIEAIKDITIHDLSFITELPRYIDGYIQMEEGKKTIDSISIDKLLG